MTLAFFEPYQDLPLDIYLVGGAVRDLLLKRPVKDYDYLVVGSTVEQMLALDFVPVGKDFPVFLHPKTKAEFALARTEKKQGTGYTGFSCYFAPEVTLADDLKRRDLTVNAMAMNREGRIIDPYSGQQDLQHKVLRHVSPAFAEDPLRVLRVARFAARYAHLGFTIAEETLSLMQQITASGEIATLTPERVWQEMSKSLLDNNAEIFFLVLRQCNALVIIWPELNKLWGVPNPAQWHPEICSGIHTMMVLQQACLLSNELDVRFAALCHDLGKGLTAAEHYPSHRGHEKSGLPLVKEACQKFKVANKIKQLSLLVCEYHLHCHKAFELKATTLLKLFNAVDLWRQPTVFEHFLLACEADAKGRLGLENNPYPQKKYLLHCARAAQKVTATEFVAQGLQGKAIKEAMVTARINAINRVKAQYELKMDGSTNG
jgi:tRNA nucleotidyltransferase (CCA-adding enzyme)